MTDVRTRMRVANDRLPAASCWADIPASRPDGPIAALGHTPMAVLALDGTLLVHAATDRGRLVALMRAAGVAGTVYDTAGSLLAGLPADLAADPRTLRFAADPWGRR